MAVNLKSFAFLDHWISPIGSVPAETETIGFFLETLKMLMLWSLHISTTAIYLPHGLIARAPTPFATPPRENCAIDSIVCESQTWIVDLAPHSPVTTMFLYPDWQTLKSVISSWWQPQLVSYFFCCLVFSKPPKNLYLLVEMSWTIPRAADMYRISLLLFPK